MDALLRLSPTDRRLACLQAEDRMRLQAASVEKDFWVCWILRELFSFDGIGSALTFKGGTSLSKAWQLIQRFSEDIDIVVDKAVLGFGGDASPEHAPSAKQRDRRMKDLRVAAREWVQTTLLPTLDHRIRASLGDGGWRLEVDPDDADGQSLLFHYPCVFSDREAGYVKPIVKIELGARSDIQPNVQRTIVPYLAEIVPRHRDECTFPVHVLAAERTFWEKAMLLHEETSRPPEKRRAIRLARHYYDVWCMIEAGVAERAAADRALFDRAAQHRELYFRQTWVDYTSLRPGSLRLLPPKDQLKSWQKDYDAMRGVMFFGEVPDFAEILRVVGEFETRFNARRA